MKQTYKIPVTASFSVYIPVEAHCLEEAIYRANRVPLPNSGDWEYIGNFEVYKFISEFPEELFKSEEEEVAV